MRFDTRIGVSCKRIRFGFYSYYITIRSIVKDKPASVQKPNALLVREYNLYCNIVQRVDVIYNICVCVCTSGNGSKSKIAFSTGADDKKRKLE